MPYATVDQLHASETRYRRLFESAQDGILILNADSGRIVDANPFMVKMLGYSHSDFVGKELWEIGLFEDVNASKVAFLELQENGYIRYEDLPLSTASGQQIDVEFVSNIYPVDDKLVIQCNIRDITDRKKAEKARQKAAGLLRGLVNHLPHRILVKDRNSVVLFCNANYAGDLGLPPESIVGQDAFAIHTAAFAEASNADDQQVMSSGVSTNTERAHETAEGSRWVHTVKVPYHDEAGMVIGVLELFEDITEKRRLQDQSRQSQKMESIGLLAGGVAHDFNNLLTVVRGHCDLITASLNVNDPLVNDIEQIRVCSDRATNLTRQLLAFSRKQLLEVRVLDLNALVTGVDNMLQRLIGEDIDMQALLAADVGRVIADPGQIEQVMMNLVLNARDAMPTGGKITIETANVELDDEYAGQHLSVTPGQYVMLAVTDNGSGMDAETRSRVFEPFFTTKEQGKGTGLGLSTVYGIVKQSGGSVWCYSEVGQGTTFKVYLPRAEGDAEVAAPPARHVHSAHRPETVLVVEDEELVRRLIVRMLTGDGYNVIATANGSEALREVEGQDVTIDIVITDLVMPGMGGSDLSRALADIRPGIKVLFMSGYTADTVLRNGRFEAGTAFLQKPFTKDSLARKVRATLDS